MARVFVSYRRADGQYGVGWLAERLRTLDSITGVETAFHDSALRAGDDFPQALEREIAESDLVIAVIGPEWLGERHDGAVARIQDPDDWVVHELGSAFRQHTRVLPVLVGGADHPLASQVHESIEQIATLHTVPFNDVRDLGTIVDHVESHLADVDRARARRAGLAEPITVPTLPRLPLVVTLAIVAAAAGAVSAIATWWFDRCGGPCPPGGVTETPAYVGFIVFGTVFAGLAATTIVVGIAIVVRLHRVVEHRWSQILAVIGVALLSIVLITVSMPDGLYGITAAETLVDPARRFWAGMLLTCVPAGLWAFAGLSARFGSVRAPAYEVGERVRALGILRDAERWAVICLTAIATFVAVNSALLVLALSQADAEPDATANPIPNLALALFMVVLVFALHISATPRLGDLQADVERELADLPPRYREHAAPRLIATTFDEGGWGLRIMLVLPLVVACVGAIVIWTTA